MPRDGVSPLEGIVETDWAVATFTMSWQLTRPGTQVTFGVGDAVCMLVPQRRGEAPARPVIRPISDDPGLESEQAAWHRSR